jgi:hypothetical protein
MCVCVCVCIYLYVYVYVYIYNMNKTVVFSATTNGDAIFRMAAQVKVYWTPHLQQFEKFDFDITNFLKWL